MYDHAQSPRLGQPAPVESTGIRIFTGSTLPEVAYPGQMIYRSDTRIIQVYNYEVGGWRDVLGGNPGIITFVGPTAPTAVNIGDLWYDTSNGHALNQWDGSVWVLSPLGPSAIGNESIRAEHLDADNITGITLTGNTFRTAAQGARVELGPQGLLLFDSAEVLRQVATMGGDIHAGALKVDNKSTFSDDMSLYGTAVLNDGISAPITKPELTPGWRYINSVGGTLSKTNWIGLTDSGAGSWVTLHMGNGFDGATQPVIITLNQTTGAVTENALTWAISGTSTHRQGLGITRIGTSYYLYTSDGGPGTQRYVHQFNSTFTETAVINMNTALNNASITQEWVMGTDGVNLVFAANRSSNSVLMTKISVTGTFVSSSSLGLNKPAIITSYWNGAADFGATRSVMTTAAANTTRVCDTSSTAVRHTEQEWTLPSANQRGLWWDGSRFWSLDSNGKVVRYSIVTVDGAETWTYAWSDGGTGRSLPSPVATVTRMARQYIHVKTATPPSGTRVAVYGAVSPAARTLQITLSLGVTDSDEGSAVPSATVENVTNTLSVVLTPGAMAATTGGFSVNGKSNGSVGTGTFRDSVDSRVQTMVLSGIKNSGALTNNIPKDVVVTFSRSFSSIPVVVATPSITGDPASVHVVVHTISTTGFTMRFIRTVSTAFDAMWIASSA